MTQNTFFEIHKSLQTQKIVPNICSPNFFNLIDKTMVTCSEAPSYLSYYAILIHMGSQSLIERLGGTRRQIALNTFSIPYNHHIDEVPEKKIKSFIL